MTSPATPPLQPDRRRLASVTALHADAEPAGPGMNSVEACAAAGITYRQLDYWARCGYLHALNEEHLGQGSVRRFSNAEVEVAGLAKVLLDAGFTILAALQFARVVVETGEPVSLAGGLVTINAEVGA